jgi:hypothetical protein
LENGPENTLVYTSQVEEMHVTYKKEKSSEDWEVIFYLLKERKENS